VIEDEKEVLKLFTKFAIKVASNLFVKKIEKVEHSNEIIVSGHAENSDALTHVKFSLIHRGSDAGNDGKAFDNDLFRSSISIKINYRIVDA
jgi:hypothetical protein